MINTKARKEITRKMNFVLSDILRIFFIITFIPFIITMESVNKLQSAQITQRRKMNFVFSVRKTDILFGKITRTKETCQSISISCFVRLDPVPALFLLNIAPQLL